LYPSNYTIRGKRTNRQDGVETCEKELIFFNGNILFLLNVAMLWDIRITQYRETCHINKIVLGVLEMFVSFNLVVVLVQTIGKERKKVLEYLSMDFKANLSNYV